MMEELSNIDTVQDLLNAQTEETVEDPTEQPKKVKLTKEQKKAKKIISKIMDESPSVGLLVSEAVISNLASWHRSVYAQRVEDGKDANGNTGWIYDCALLDQALKMLEQVDLG